MQPDEVVVSRTDAKIVNPLYYVSFKGGILLANPIFSSYSPNCRF
jgi:hypothetical protein